MKLYSTLLLTGALAAHADAQRNSEPRTARPIPIQSSEKIAAPAPQLSADPTRPAPTTPLQSVAKTPGRDEAPTTRIAPRDELYFANEADGATWVRGRTYKARFGPGGATYIPYLGSRAPRNFPLELSLGNATVGGVQVDLAPALSAVREGDRIVIDRGPIDEVYELGLDHVEQTFVVSERPASGDLKLFVSLQSELARNATADGIEFSNELGSVRYGNAFVREANGVKVPVASRLVEGGVEIEVAASYLAGAAFPLVVDPVISTFLLDNNGVDQVETDTSYDLSTDRFLIAYQETFSATDHDIFAQLRDSNGVVFAANFLDISSENWLSPQTANLNNFNQFICVAQCDNVLGSPGTVIRGLTVEAATFAQGFKFNISTTDATGDKILADVGGDPYDGGDAFYCVVWQRNFTATDTDIHARLVSSTSTLVGPGTILIDNSGSTIDSWPSISKSNGQLGGGAAWTVAWHRHVSANNLDIHAARLSWDGTILNGSTPLVVNSTIDYYPRVSSPLNDGRTLVVWAHNFSTDHDLFYALLSGTTIEMQGNLTTLDASPTLFQDQVEYSIDSDGQYFAVAYAENFSTSTFDYDIWVSSFIPFAGTLRCVEAHQSLDFTGEQSLRTDIIAKHSGGDSSRRFQAVWDTTVSGGQRNIFGGFYDRPLGGGYQSFCAGDVPSVCPCNNNGSTGNGCANSLNPNGARLQATGNAQTGSGDTLSFTVTGVPPIVSSTLFQGTVDNGGGFFGDGLRCVGGSQIRIRTKSSNSSGSATWPTGSEADISVTGLVPLGGAERFYQVSYRNAASFCTSATFNISNGVRVLWLP
jgi:hypothetical protein